MSEEPHDNWQRITLLVEVRGLCLSQHLALDRLRDSGTANAAGPTRLRSDTIELWIGYPELTRVPNCAA